MAKPLEFFFDYISPFSYLADIQLPALLERTGAGTVYKPILLGGIFKASNNTPPPAIPAKFKYNAVDAMRWRCFRRAHLFRRRCYVLGQRPNAFHRSGAEIARGDFS